MEERNRTIFVVLIAAVIVVAVPISIMTQGISYRFFAEMALARISAPSSAGLSMRRASSPSAGTI